MNTTITAMLLGILIISMTVSSVSAVTEISLHSPYKQRTSGTSAEDIVCNVGLTLIAKLSTGFSVCVKPSSASKLESLGWGQILKQSTMMDDARQMMIEKITNDNIIYNPSINPADFSIEITNLYFSLPVGKKLVYESQADGALETIEILIPGWAKNIMGVETLVFWDRVYEDGVLIEDTRDYLAQHKNGDIWYFGEDVDNYEDGKLLDHDGAWIAGIDGAKPGIWVKQQRVVGDEYYQEYYAGFAEDKARTTSIDEMVSVKYGAFTDCVKTLEFSPLFSATAYKYDCNEVGATVLEEDLDSDGNVEQRSELVDVDLYGALGLVVPDAYAKEGVVSDEGIYNPIINPADFTTNITNPYVTLPVGKLIVFDANTEDGVERIEILVTDETKTVMGVETLVYWDRVWIEGVLLEETRDWLAQDKEGNVWYFGEEVDNYSNGVLIDHAGSWEAGVDGAKPGIWMIANPHIGELYRQEYYAGQAEDLSFVLSLDESVTVEFGTFSGCLKTQDWTPLEPGVYEHKYYCLQVGNMVLEEKPSDDEIVELIDVQYDQLTSSEPEPTPKPTTGPEPISTEITADQAKEIAQSEYGGVVTDISTEYKFGEFAWVVELATNMGEYDVTVSKITSKILGIEN